MIKGIFTIRKNESILRRMMQYINDGSKIVLFVHQNNTIAIEAYARLGFTFSEDLVYSEYHETDKETKLLDD